MKVIFLDHDGVICLSTEWGGRFKKQREAGRKLSQSVASLPVMSRFDNFNKKAINVLNSILEETGAEIVVSSDWKRWANVEEMGEYYESQGIIKKPIAFTPNLGQCTWYIEAYPAGFMWSREWDMEQTRSIEILHSRVTYEHEWGLDNFVETPRGTEGIKQSGIKEKILKFLI